MKPTHDGAEKIVTELHPFICKMSQDYKDILPDDDGAVKEKMSSDGNKGGFSKEISKDDINGIEGC